MIVKDSKEEFCGACLAIPVAIAGAGVAGVGGSKGGHSKTKKILLGVGISITVISVVISIVFLTRCKTCQ